jgi:hypothetical protein
MNAVDGGELTLIPGRVFSWWNWRRGLVVGVVLCSLLFPLVGPETSYSPKEVLELYYWYLRNFQYAKAFYLVTDHYKDKHFTGEARSNKWLFQPQTPFAKTVWGTLEIIIQPRPAAPRDGRIFKVALIDYKSAEKVEATVTLVKISRRWEIDDITETHPKPL